jgi:hypothetical protein
VLAKLIDRVFYSGFEAAKESATSDIVARLSRGNTAAQGGHVLDEPEIQEMRVASARAMRRLANKVAKARAPAT